MLIDLLFPKQCVSCGKFGAYMCKTCENLMTIFTFSVCPVCDRPTHNGKTHDVCKTSTSLDGLIAITKYAKPASSLVHAVKYHLVRDASSSISEIIQQHWPPYAPVFDLLIPIPLHPKKLQQRGFNQAAIIAHHLSSFLQIPTSTNTLIKIRETPAQASLKKEKRIKNKELKQSFVCLFSKNVQNKIVGLIDDVTTTRATLSFACESLKKVGAKEVWGVVFAHSF